MISQIFKRKINTIIEFPRNNNHPPEHALLVGKFAQAGRPLLARRWSDNGDLNSRLAGDESFFAPSVRKLRLANYRLHKTRASHPIKRVWQPESPYYGKTWLLVGSGPSLEYQADVLSCVKRNHPGVVVVAINDAMRCIGPSNIHGFIALCWGSNPKWWSMEGLEGVDLFTSFYTPIGILDSFDPERIYHFSTPLLDRMTPYINEDIEKFGALDAGLTVSYSALHLAFRCKASKIILVGQDMAYTGQKNHAYEPLSWDVAKTRNCRVVRDINGNMAVTDDRMQQHVQLMWGAAYWCEKAGVPVYNSSGQGILDLGRTRNIPLKEALETK